jgi:hypothetical protein
MEAGDLVVLWALARSATLSVYDDIANNGGQTWNTTTINTATLSLSGAIHWCIFDGTWDANPQFGGVGSSVPFTLYGIVFRSDNDSTIELDAACDTAVNQADSSNVCTIPANEISTSQANCLLVAGWAVSAINTWSSITSGWTYSADGSPTQVRNTSGSDTSLSMGWLIQAGSGNNAAASNTHSTGGQNFARFIIAFREAAGGGGGAEDPFPYVGPYGYFPTQG